MSALFASDEMFEITVKYMEIPTKSGLKTVKVLDDEKEADRKLMENRPGDVKELHTFWVIPNFRMTNDLYRKCTYFDTIKGGYATDWPMYRSLHLEMFMKRWDVTEESGKPIPCTKEYIDKLEANVASALIDRFFDRQSITEEELGN